MTQPSCLLTNFECRTSCSTGRAVASQRTSYLAFVGISSLLFAISVALTVTWCTSMSAMRGMPMPGGWTMSMMWMRMPGQTWCEATASFLAMWVVMMTAMMLPSHVPVLWRYRRAVRGRGESHVGRLTLIAGVGYFFVWTLLGLVVFSTGAALARVEMKRAVLARTVPVTVGAVMVIAGALQFTSWKAHHLARCRDMPADARTAWQQGIQFGFHCSLSCANLTAILLALGAMDLRAMTLVSAAITAERLTPAGERVAHAIGAVVIVIGLVMITRVIALE
jgi:predicted metal-binding membrane protein